MLSGLGCCGTCVITGAISADDLVDGTGVAASRVIAIATLQTTRLMVVRCALIALSADSPSIVLLIRRDADLLYLVAISA